MIKIFPVFFIAVIIFTFSDFDRNVYSQELISIDSIHVIMEKLQEENNWARMITVGESSLRKGYDSFF
ncbi:MAG: hypothetical protein R3A12_02845 [Ignavibacteria bacterium]